MFICGSSLIGRLQRDWGVLSILGLACTILGTWEGLLA